MSRLLGSVRFRVTAVATVVVAVLLAAASVVILRFVENDLIGEAEDVVGEAIVAVREDLGAVALPEDTFLEYDFAGGTLFVGLIEEGDEIVGPLIDPETGDWVGELIIDPATGEVLEAFIEEGELADQPVPGELEELVASAVRLDDGEFLIAGVPLDGVRESIAALRRNLLIIVPVLIVLLAVVVWLLVGRALRPVGAITEQARRITTQTLHERVPEPATDDEVGDLARVVNDMLDRLEQGADRQRQFVSDASHELRTPLASIRAAAELTESTTDPGRARSLARDVLAEADRMDELVTDLLALARLDEGRSEQNELVDLQLLSQEAAERFGSNGITVQAVPSPPAQVVGDRPSLQRAVDNLVANAVRHARRHVTIRTTVDEGAVRLEVIDDGPGIDPVDRERVFDRFVRLDEARRATGFGLGLAIVRSAVTGHGGTTRVGEPPPGGGTTLVVELPASA